MNYANKFYSSKAITIFIPCYNRINYIEPALESALRQDYKNKEVVVMDDCSSDGSYEKLQGLQKKWGFALLRTDRPKRGPYWIFNRIIELYDTEYFQVLDSDDILLENTVTRMLQFMEEEFAGIAGGQYILIDERGDIREEWKAKCWRPYDANFARRIREGQHLNNSGTAWKREALDKTGKFNENMMYTADYDFAARALEGGVIIRNAPFYTVKYRLHKDSLTTSHLFGVKDEQMLKEVEALRKMYPPYLRFDERYIDFFEQEFNMVLDEKRPTLEKWFIEYLEKFNKEIRIKHTERIASLIERYNLNLALE